MCGITSTMRAGYVCHIGHRLAWPAVAAAQLARIEFSLGAAMTQTKEYAELCRQLSEHGEIDGHTADRLVAEATERAERIKDLLTLTSSIIPGAK
jgi:hypothetical protein